MVVFSVQMMAKSQENHHQSGVSIYHDTCTINPSSMIYIYIYWFFVRILVSCKLTSPFRTGALPSSGSQPCHSHRCQFRAYQYHTWRSARRPWSPSSRSRRKKDTVVGIQIWPKIELGYLHGYMMIYDDILCIYHACIYIYIMLLLLISLVCTAYDI